MICDLIIPALNERANIDALFAALEKGVRHHFRNVILADNGSADGTPDAARGCGAIVVHEPQRGYGAACLKAMEWIATLEQPPDVVAFLDADLADDPAALPLILQPIADGRADFVIGSRVKLAEPGALNFVQRFGNGLACVLMRLATGSRYTDLGPFRAIRWDALQRLRMADRTWGWTVEMQMKAAILNVPTVEVDVAYRRRRHGRSKISGTVRGVIKAGTKIIVTIVALYLQRRGIARSETEHHR